MISSVVLLVLTVATVIGGLFYLGRRIDRRNRRMEDAVATRVHVAYAGAWLLSIVAACLAMFGAGGFRVAVPAIVPIVLLAPPAVLGPRALLGRPAVEQTPPTEARAS